ncbi:MAG TPA: FG-GAP-like repeat-containing protein, partial [Nitrosospira sp.]|nr:FG-GAP-like repeat-containing protein [Nitrosospira sp.]
RLNTDGTRDLTFNSALTFPTTSVHSLGVTHIKPLANGQFLITGGFRIGSQNTNYARINSDGSVDAAFALGFASGGDVEPLPDGKFLACGSRVIGGETYQIAHRLNADGTPDPAFRLTIGTGECHTLKLLSSGKILMMGGSGPGMKDIYRLNPDGTLDPSFDTDIPVGSLSIGLTEASDGKIFVNVWAGTDMRLKPDGRIDAAISQCKGGVFLPLENGGALATNCNKSPGSFQFLFARILPDGTVDPTLDYFPIPGSNVYGYMSGGGGRYFLFGDLTSPFSSRDIIRIEPDLATKPKFDFDGDRRSDVGVFRPSEGYWYINQSTAGYAFTHWGLAGDKLDAHDFDGDGKTDIAVFRNGDLHVLSTLTGYRGAQMGQAGDKPLVGTFFDFSTFLNKEMWIVRGDRSGIPAWYVWQGPGATPGPMTLAGELSTDKPIVGDFDGDSWDDIGYFRDGAWYNRLTSQEALVSFHWGTAGDIPAAADYDGDRQTDYAVFRPSTGDWYVMGSTAGYFAMHWGASGDIPVPADYDGDGKADIAIYRNGDWWQFLSATGSVNFVHWGMTGDLPVEAQMQ